MKLETLYWRFRLVRRFIDWLYLRTYGFTWADVEQTKQEYAKHLAELEVRARKR